MKEYIWHEHGWYDCCSGLWFVHYELLDEDCDIVMLTSDEERIPLYNLVLSRLGVDSLDYRNMHVVESVVELLEDLGTVVNDVHLKGFGLTPEIVRDETIDYSMTYTCMG